MSRKLYYVDWYGQVQRDRKAERRQSAGTGWTGKVLRLLAALALIMVIASVLSSLH